MTDKNRARPADQAFAVSVEPANSLDPTGFDPSRGVVGEILRPESCDSEIADMMTKLSHLQSWLVLRGCERNGDPMFMGASSLIQDVRVLLVERCFNRPAIAQTEVPNDR